MYNEPRSGLVGASTLRRDDIKQRLLNQKVDIERRLREIDEAIEVLDKNPDLAKLFDCLRNAGF